MELPSFLNRKYKSNE